MSMFSFLRRLYLLLLPLFPLLDALAECHPQDAHYILSGDSTWSAGFIDIGHHPGWQSDLAFYVRSQRTGKTYWFLPDSGSARYINLISTTEVTALNWAPPDPDGGNRPLGEMHYFAFDKKLIGIAEMPRSNSSAPDRLFLPDLSDIMWYRTDPMARETVMSNIFVLSKCASSPVP